VPAVPDPFAVDFSCHLSLNLQVMLKDTPNLPEKSIHWITILSGHISNFGLQASQFPVRKDSVHHKPSILLVIH
jgi:hypothetical protein